MPNIAIMGCGLIGVIHAKCLSDLGVRSALFADAGEMPHNGKFTFQAMNGKKTVHLL